VCFALAALVATAASCDLPVQHEPQLHPYGGGVKSLRVNCAARAGVIRPRIGTNRGPVNWPSDPAEPAQDYAGNFRRFGIEALRSHDFYGPTDWWVLFPDWSADPGDAAAYDFASSDARIGAIRDAGFECLYRLGTSWRGDNPLPVNDPPGTTYAPNGQVAHEADRPDFEKWAQICVGTVRHYNQGWAGGHACGIRYWEIWNEPDMSEQFWSGTAEQYFILYEETAKALKALDPALKVGGPGLSGSFTGSYLEGLLDHCRQTGAPLDFYSWHQYGGRDEYNPHCYYDYARRVRDALNQYGYGKAESIVTEWNAGVGDNTFSDTPAGVAYYASALMNMLDGGVTWAFQYVGDNHPMLGLHDHDTHEPVRATQALIAWKRMLSTPLRVTAVGSDEFGYNIAAGMDETGRRVHVLISDFQSDYSGFALKVTNLPWTELTPFAVTRWLLDPSREELEAVETIHRTGRTFVIKRNMSRRTICLFEIRRGFAEPQPAELDKPDKVLVPDSPAPRDPDRHPPKRKPPKPRPPRPEPPKPRPPKPSRPPRPAPRPQP